MRRTCITPVLSSTAGWVTDVRDQIASFIRFVIMNPGNTSSLWETDMVSFRKLASAFEGTREALCNELERRLNTSFARMFPDFRVSAECTTSDYDSKNDDGRYTIAFNVTIDQTNNGDPNDITTTGGLISGSIAVDEKNHNSIEVRFDRNQDTAAL